MLMCKAHFTEETMGYRTLGHLRRVNFDEKDLFTGYLQNRLGLLVDAYTSLSVDKLTFTYIIKDGLASNHDRRLLQDLLNKNIGIHRYNNIRLPISMIPEDYGSVLLSNIVDDFTRYIVTDNRKTYQIDISLDNLTNKVKIIGEKDLSWTDTKLEEGFQREIGKSILYFVDGEKVLRKSYLSAKPFRKLHEEKTLSTEFITFDIETIKTSDGLNPYLICGYTGKDYITSYAYDNYSIDKINSNDSKKLFKRFLDQLLEHYSESKKTLIIYAHNFAGFDGIFLKHLINFGEVDPQLFNGKLMGIKLKTKCGLTIIFKDSYLMLPQSLRKLSIAFNIISSKGYFPFLLNNIFYRGIIPSLEYWTGIPLNEYESLLKEFTGKTWDFKEESTKYCKLDCKALHEVLSKFNELVFEEFKVNMTSCLTLPSLAMKIYKTHYMPKDKIYQILGEVERAIRESYTGGAVDVYKTHNKIGNIFKK